MCSMREEKLKGPWVAQLVKHLGLGLAPVSVLGPIRIRLCAQQRVCLNSLAPSAPPPTCAHTHSLSQIHK